MTKRLFSTVVDHSSNAGFQAWATELYNEMIAVGLTQATDTGQLSTPVTAARPVATTAAGYWIFRFDDTNQATSPIFIKMEVGSSGAAVPAIWVTVGTGANGAGTITGVFSARENVAGRNSIGTATAYPTYICLVGGFFGLAWKAGAQGSTSIGNGLLLIARSSDDNGDSTSDGCAAYIQSNATVNARSVDFGSGVLATTSAGYCLIHYGLTNTAHGSDFQVFQHYGVFGRVRPLSQIISVVTAEVPDGTTFSTAAVGTTPRTYINIGSASYNNAGAAASPAGAHRIAMLWE